MCHHQVLSLCLLLVITLPYVSAGSLSESSPGEVTQCPLISHLIQSIPGAEKETSMCTFAVLSLSTYIYRPGQPMKLLLLSTSKQQTAKYYNVEVVDQKGNAVGEFLSGDNICNSGRMVTNSVKLANQQPVSKVSFTWRAPPTNLGTLFFKFSIGVETSPGKVSFWLQCDRQTPLKYFGEIDSDILHSIENPLADHTNHQKVTATPSDSVKVIHDSLTTNKGQGLKGKHQVTAAGSSTTFRPIFKDTADFKTSGSTLAYMYTDGYSWCKPLGAPRFQIVPGTGCTRYRMFPNSETFLCFPGLMFSVVNCGCTYQRDGTKCTFP